MDMVFWLDMDSREDLLTEHGQWKWYSDWAWAVDVVFWQDTGKEDDILTEFEQERWSIDWTWPVEMVCWTDIIWPVETPPPMPPLPKQKLIQLTHTHHSLHPFTACILLQALRFFLCHSLHSAHLASFLTRENRIGNSGTLRSSFTSSLVRNP